MKKKLTPSDAAKINNSVEQRLELLLKQFGNYIFHKRAIAENKVTDEEIKEFIQKINNL